MADEENAEAIQPAIPTGRVKKIMQLDKDINRVTPEAVFLVSCSTELFLKSLAEKAAQVAVEKKRRIVKLDFIRAAVKRHRPTSDFLLDCLPATSQPVDRPASDRVRSHPAADKPVPAGARRIDAFFAKSSNEAPNGVDELRNEAPIAVDEPTIEAPFAVDEPTSEAPVEVDEPLIEAPPIEVDEPRNEAPIAVDEPRNEAPNVVDES